MTRNRWFWATLCVVMGALQAWDSGVLGSTPGVQFLVAAAVALPALTLVMTEHYGRQALAVAAALVLLTVARMASPVSLPTLAMAAFIPAIVIFFINVVGNRPVTEA